METEKGSFARAIEVSFNKPVIFELNLADRLVFAYNSTEYMTSEVFKLIFICNLYYLSVQLSVTLLYFSFFCKVRVLNKRTCHMVCCHFRYLHYVLTKNSTVNETNRGLLVETLRSIAEILIWGDQNDSRVFE